MLGHFKKALRASQTDAENILWYHLRNRHLAGFKFRRQYVLYGYIVDFVCLEKKLIIELDGGQHADKAQYDEMRTQILKENGFHVVRFWNNEVFENVQNILEVIHYALTPHPPLRGDLSHKGRGEITAETIDAQ